MTSTLFDFSDPLAATLWHPIDDTVMGGVSTSQLRQNATGHAVFTGHVSLENNGGFASVRSQPGALGQQGVIAYLLQVRGGGKRYKLNLRRGWRGFHHHTTLFIAAYDFLVTERLRHKYTKKTPYSARNLPYPKVTCRGAARRAQRHVLNSISTLRWTIAQTLASRLQRCPCCARKSQEIDWLF